MSQDLDQQVRKAVADYCRRLPRRHPVTSIVIVGLMGISLAIFLIWQVPHWQVPKAGMSTKEWLHQINENRKTVAQIVGGVFILWGLYIAWVRSKAMRDQTEVDREQQLTDLYVKAIEQLGNENIHIRLGGIYALERIARESAKDHWPIMEVLTAFVRENAARRWGDLSGPPPEEDNASPPPPYKPLTDIQAVLTVLCRRSRTLGHGEEHPLDLRATHLANADLRNAQLQGALLGEANLDGAVLSNAKLQGANLWQVNLHRADLASADLQGALLILANFQWANLSGAKLQWTRLDNANLNKANLGEVDLQGATLHKANLKGTNLWRANFQWASLVRANLQGADLEGAEGLATNQVAEAIWDETTRWPEGFSPPTPRKAKDKKEE